MPSIASNDDLDLGPFGANLCDNPFELFHGACRGVNIGRSQPGNKQMRASENIHEMFSNCIAIRVSSFKPISEVRRSILVQRKIANFRG